MSDIKVVSQLMWYMHEWTDKVSTILTTFFVENITKQTAFVTLNTEWLRAHSGRVDAVNCSTRVPKHIQLTGSLMQ